MTVRNLRAATLLMTSVAAHAQSPEVTVATPWSRATPQGASTGAAYLTLTSPAGDTLTGVSSPAAKMAQVHEMKMDGNVMRMREVQGGLALPPGTTVTLQPNGLHIMLMGLTAPLKQGQMVKLHLTFAKAPPEDVTAPIGPLGSTRPPGQAGSAVMPGMPTH